MDKLWPYIALASYLSASFMCAIWVTDGGTYNTRVPRWRLCVVCIIWPLIMIYGLTERFVEWFFKPPMHNED